jgi:hypothetical protein
MFFNLRLRLEAYHVPTEKWHVYETTHGLRAVSRRHALDKGLRVLEAWPGYVDRVDHADWKVAGDVAILADTPTVQGAR